MGQAEPVKKHYTFEEYLEMERVSDEKHEYYYGEIFNMAGGTVRHSLIISNIHFALRKQITNIDCETLFDVRLELNHKSYYVYPDLMVRCSKEKDDALIVRTPIIIFEVLSESTEEYDRGTKLRAYMQIPTLKHYVLVAQKNCKVECYTRQGNDWLFNIYTSLEEFLSLTSLDINISLADIYQNIIFDTELKIKQ